MASYNFQLTLPFEPDPDPVDSAQPRESLLRVGRLFRRVAVGNVPGSSTVVCQTEGTAASGTITLATCAAGTVVEVNGVPFTARASGTAIVANNEFTISGTDAADATALAAAINACTDTRVSGVVTATSTGASGVVTLTASRAGYEGNTVTLKTLGIVASDVVTLSAVDVSDTLTINGQALTGIKQRATGTLTAASAVAGTTCKVNGVTFTGQAGAVVLGEPTFSIDTGDTETATSLAAQINAYTGLNISGKITATSSGAVVTLRAVDAGTAGNSLTLSGTAVVLAASGAALSGGIAVANNQFDVSPGATNTQVATDLARCINASTTAAISSYVRATSDGATVTVYSKIPGLVGNSITCAGNDADVSAATARLAGGTVASHEGVQASGTVTIAAGGSGNYTVTINGVAAASAINWNTSETQTATDIVAAIQASTNAAVRGVVTATNAAGVITITAVRGGVSGNAISLAASGSAVTPSVSGAFLASGAVPTTVVLSGERLTGGSSTSTTLSF